MKRRNFLKYGLSAISLPILIQGQALGLIPDNAVLKALTSGNKTRKLILIHLKGGNDGLNMFTPLDQYINLRKARPNIIIPQEELIRLTDVLGMHPAMNSFKRLYDLKQALIIQNVSYPSPSLSHFQSQTIVNNASSTELNWNSGWLGRYFQNASPDFPTDFPNTEDAHPLAITIGTQDSPISQGDTANYSISMTDASNNFQQPIQQTQVEEDSPYNHELRFITEAIRVADAYLDPIQEAASKGGNQSPLYPEDPKNQLAKQLALVARLIGGGLETPIYVLSLDGFDTHSNQVASESSTTQGHHASLLRYLADGILAFQDDLNRMGLEENVIGMVYSEFGRRIASSENLGTDHGTAYPAILFGQPINPTVLGHNPTIPEEVNPFMNLDMQFDFRSIYASIFQQWFQLPEATTQQIMGDEFPILPILKTAEGSTFFYENPVKVTAYPIPTADYLNLKIETKNPQLRISLFNPMGQFVKTLFNQEVEGNLLELQFSVKGLPAGHYILRVQSGNDLVSKKLIITD